LRPWNILRQKSHADLTEVLMPAARPTAGLELPNAPSLDDIVERNIRALVARRKDNGNTPAERIAGAATQFIGSFRFLLAHGVVFAIWVLANTLGMAGIPKFDPSLMLLGTLTSVEAIFLSTLVLIAQNRNLAAAEQRGELDLQINLLTEHELTRLIHLVSAMAQRLNVRSNVDEEIKELKQDVAVSAVLDKLESAESPQTGSPA
jgi:uncharacterized membrane protein